MDSRKVVGNTLIFTTLAMPVHAGRVEGCVRLALECMNHEHTEQPLPETNQQRGQMMAVTTSAAAVSVFPVSGFLTR